MPVPPFDRYIYVLSSHVVKNALAPQERGYDGYIPDFATLTARDENELEALKLVREYTNIPVPQLLHQGRGSEFLALYRRLISEQGHSLIRLTT